MSLAKLSDYYILCQSRLADPKYKNDIDDLNFLVSEIKKNWNSSRILNDQKKQGRVEKGLMAVMGYRVGDTQGVNEVYRRLIITDVLYGPLPLVGNHDYMNWWGLDKTKFRLNRMKSWLRDKIYSPQHKNHHRAIGEWQEDLDWLEIYGDELINK